MEGGREAKMENECVRGTVGYQKLTPNLSSGLKTDAEHGFIGQPGKRCSPHAASTHHPLDLPAKPRRFVAFSS